jgi:Tfp pilus assembly protein PilF
VARAIAERVRATVTPAESARLVARRPVDPEAYQLYLQGRYHWARRGDSLPRALDLYRAAVAREPSFAAAHAGLAETYAVMGSNYAAVAEVAALTRQAAQKALDLDPQLASAWSARGMARLQFDWDWRGAEADLRRALELNPGSGTAHQWYSRCLLAQGRGQEAIAEAEQAVALDPLAPIVHNALAMALCYSRRHERAVRAAQETLRLDPRLGSTRLHLALAHLGRGDCAAAVAALEEAEPEETGDHWFRGFLGHVYARCGRAADARAILARLPGDTQPLPRAIVYAGLGEPDHAFEWLDRAWGQRTEALLWLKVQPVFDSLRGDPRFGDLLRRVGLPID